MADSSSSSCGDLLVRAEQLEASLRKALTNVGIIATGEWGTTERRGRQVTDRVTLAQARHIASDVHADLSKLVADLRALSQAFKEGREVFRIVQAQRDDLQSQLESRATAEYPNKAEAESFHEDPESRASLDSPDRCNGCGGEYRFDTSIPSVVWNSVIRAQGLSEYLCAACILRAFAHTGVSFTAELSGDGFQGTPIEVVINHARADDIARVNEENNRLRSELSEVSQALHQAKEELERRGRTTHRNARL